MRMHLLTVLITVQHALQLSVSFSARWFVLLLADGEITTLSPACISTSIFNFILLPFLFTNTISLARFSI